MKKWSKSVLMILSLLVVTSILLWKFNNIDNDKIIVDAFNNIELEITLIELEKILSRQKFEKLRLIKLDQNKLLIQSPVEWNAENWVIWIDFNNGKVISVKIRLHDSQEIHPNNAARDKAVTM